MTGGTGGCLRISAASSPQTTPPPSAPAPHQFVQAQNNGDANTVIMKYITVAITKLSTYFSFMRHRRKRMYAQARRMYVTAVTRRRPRLLFAAGGVLLPSRSSLFHAEFALPMPDVARV